MSKAILYLNEYLLKLNVNEIETLAKYLFNNVLFIYVSTEDLQDAFRLFTILNDRGIPLTNSDILKAKNLGIISNENLKLRLATEWEEIEGNFGIDEFDRLLSHIRTILVKEKARENILKEFEDKIYSAKPQLLKRGEDTLKLLIQFADIYSQLIWFNNLPSNVDNKYINLILIMRGGIPSTDWIPPLLTYYRKYKDKELLEFLTKLDNKFSIDWIYQFTPTERLTNMIAIIRVIESSKNSSEVLNNKVLSIDTTNLTNYLSTDDFYFKKFAKYILLKLEYLLKDHTSQFSKFENISIEHVLPQNPKTTSDWYKDFTDSERDSLTNSIGNLVLLSRRKNSSLANLDFIDKKNKYFDKNIDAFPNSLKVMQNNEWKVNKISQRNIYSIKTLMDHYNK